MIYRFLLVSFLLVNTPFILHAQYGTYTARRSGLMDGNNIHTVFTNSGVLAQPSNLLPHLSWRGDNNGYFGDLSIVIGAELPLKDYNNDGKIDTIHLVEITNADRPGGGKTGVGGRSWTFEPIPGFNNAANSDVLGGIALSNNPSTWPTTPWPDHPEWGTGKWNGLIGANSFTGKQEAYFVMDDQNDDQAFELYGFRPSASDTSRRGLGFKVSVRYIQFDYPLLKDVLFRIYDITNEGTINYQKVVFGNLAGTYIGGKGDEYNDDASLYYPKEKTMVTVDCEPGTNLPYIRPEANPKWQGRVGSISESLIGSPDENGITSIAYFAPAASIVMSDNEAMWKLITPGNYYFHHTVTLDSDSIPHASRGEDGDYIYGSNYFSLNAGATKRLVAALAFDYSTDMVLQKQKIAEAFYNCGFDTTALINSIKLQNLTYYQKISGTFPIKWTSAQANGTVDLWFSPDAGATWKNITRNAPNSGAFNLNTTIFSNCTHALIRIYQRKTLGSIIGFTESHYFQILNPASSVAIFIRVLNEELDQAPTLTAKQYPLHLLIGSSTATQVQLKISAKDFNSNCDYQEYQTVTLQADSVPVTLNLNLLMFPNSTHLMVHLEATDGTVTASDDLPVIAKENVHAAIPSANFTFTSKTATATVQLRTLDEKALTGDTYQITFNDTSLVLPSTSNIHDKYFSVYDMTKSKYIVRNATLVPFSESAGFDGLTLYTEDFPTQMDSASHWSGSQSNKLGFSMWPYRDTKYLIYSFLPRDYAIIFSDSYADSSNDLTYLLKWNYTSVHNINFKIYDITDKAHPQKIKFGFAENTDQQRDTLSIEDVIILSNANGSMVYGKVDFSTDSTALVPKLGDTLYLFTKKGLSILDTIIVSGKITGVQTSTKSTVESYALMQNYPNPFNPSTVIRYDIPIAGKVTLKVYNIIGKEVATLVHSDQAAGSHSVQFNAAQFSSGVYFYTLHAGDYFQTKKMLLIK